MIVPVVDIDVGLLVDGSLMVIPAGNINFVLIDRNEIKIRTKHKIGKVSIVQLGCRNRIFLEKFKLFNHMMVAFFVHYLLHDSIAAPFHIIDQTPYPAI